MSVNFHCNNTSLSLSLSLSSLSLSLSLSLSVCLSVSLSFGMQAQSRKYNADIEVYTLRYAMVEQLRNPPKGIIIFCASFYRQYTIFRLLVNNGHTWDDINSSVYREVKV